MPISAISDVFKKLLLAAAFVAVASTAALAQGRLTPGKDYVELSPPLATETGDKNEVIEFFWYRCPHCYALEPYLESWVKKLPQDTQFRRVPAVFNDDWALDARVFYALEAIGQVDRLHRALFDQIHKNGGAGLRGPTYMKFVSDWLAKQGVDMAKYDAALRSFGVETKVKRASQNAQSYKLDGVPAIALNGRYLVSAAQVGDRQGMIDVSEALLQQARKQGVAKK
jgi:thiol:disulfide interchange protein DsbA